MITCPKCTKENQDHYKFCLGCGAELPRDAAPKKFAAGTPPQGVPVARAAGGGAAIVDETTNLGPGIRPKAAEPPVIPPLVTPGAAPSPNEGPAFPAPAAQPAFVPPRQPVGSDGAFPPAATPRAQPQGPATAPVPPVGGSSPAPAPGGAIVNCPQCDHPNPPNNKFCASCGFKLGKVMAAEAPAAAPVAVAGGPSGITLTALRADGTEAGTYTLPSGTVTIGRDTGAIFAGDSYLSPRHVTFTPRGAKLMVRDESSLNGVYKKLRRDEPIVVNFNDIFRIGQEILRFEPLTPLSPTADGVERLGSPAKGYVGRIALVIGRDATGNAYPVPEAGLHLGRERGDVLFPEDGYVSGLHCRLAWQNGHLYLTDLGSSNGTFLRLMGDGEVANGDVLLMGQQLFRITM